MSAAWRLDDALFRAWDARPDWHAHLSRPQATHLAWRLDEVVEVLARADEAAAQGRYAVVMLAYEAAPAFDPALRTAEVDASDGWPLALVAEFDPSVVDAPPLPAPQRDQPAALPLRISPAVDADTFREQVLEIQERIRAGDTYQVNLTFPIHAHAPADLAGWFDTLCESQQAGFAAHLQFGDAHVLSLSPELFFTRRANTVSVRPMKGTSPRGRWMAEDAARAEALAASAKARAENVMIVDLLRNDLGRVAIPGTVRLTDLFTVERYPTVWQLTSTVEAELPHTTTVVDLMRALFPCGSVTGAPKVSTMGIIADIEGHPRGLYTGTIGLVRPGGDCTFSVAIRTVVAGASDRRATVGVGAGITIDSDPQQEYEESVLKGRFLSGPGPLAARPSLFETLRLEDGEARRLDAHLARMRASAAFFEVPWEEARIRAAVERACATHPSGVFRLRLTVEPDGSVNATATEHTEHTGVWRVAFAAAPVDAADPLLCHKTTARAPYDAARRGRPDVDDVLLWNANGEVTESTIANIVIELDGVKYTPPITCGLLPGVLRAELVASGEVVERVLTRGMVARAEHVWLVNSLRGWMNATLVR